MTINKRAIVWDMDGVLVDSGDLHYQAWREVAREALGIEMTRERFDEMFGTDNAGVLRQLFGREPTAVEVERIGGQQDERYRELAVEGVKEVPGAFALLRNCAADGWQQAVATSAPRVTLDLILDRFALREWFAVRVTTEDVPRAKPDPAIFLLAAARLGIPPERCLVIEDSLNGIRAARAAGMRCLAVTTTHTPEALAEADRIVASLEEVSPEDLLALLEGE